MLPRNWKRKTRFSDQHSNVSEWSLMMSYPLTSTSHQTTVRMC